MKKEILLFDLDHTLLDFAATEKKGLEKCFASFSLPFTEEVRSWYLAHNQKLWSMYERGEIQRETIFRRRFIETFAHFGFQADASEMERRYRQALSEGCDLIDGALALIQTLAKTHRLFVVTNGLASTQNRRLKDSGLGQYFEKLFISEELGYQKPMKEYFNHCFAHIENFQKDSALLIGDSLSSDIQGGVNAGIETCWYNPKGDANKTQFLPTYEIRNLTDLYPILGVSPN